MSNNNNYYYDDSAGKRLDPFSDWSKLIHKPVYSIDGKKIGFLRKIVADYMVVKKGLVNLDKVLYTEVVGRVCRQKRKNKIES